MINEILAGLTVENIITLSILGVFVLVLLAFLIVYICSVNRNAKQMRELQMMYIDKNLVKMDYDFAIYDDEAETSESVVADVAESGEEASDDVVFGKVDTEGLEEITGNYKPE